MCQHQLRSPLHYIHHEVVYIDLILKFGTKKYFLLFILFTESWQRYQKFAHFWSFYCGLSLYSCEEEKKFFF